MSLEKEVVKRNKRANLRKIILAVVGLTGFMAVSLIAPNVLMAMKRLGLFPRKRQSEIITSSRNRLVKSGLLEYEKNGLLRITTLGRKVLLRETYIDRIKDKNKKWDGKWRVLIFDIPEYRKSDREYLRLTLISIGFMKLQNSVWVYPYDCEDLITLLKADMKIGKDVLYMIVEALEYDKPVRKFFGLE